MAMLTVGEKQSIQDLREAQRQAKERLKRLKVFSEGRKSEFWEALKEELAFSAKTRESIKEARERARPAGDPVKEWEETRSDRAVIDAYKGIESVVEQAELRMEKSNEKIREYGEKVKMIEENAKKRGEQRTRTTREEV